MKLRCRSLLRAAALASTPLLIIGADWSGPPRGAAAPVLIDLSPNKIAAGSPGFTLTVRGAFFVNGSAVHWNSEERPTTFVNAGVVEAQIPASDVAADGTVHVIVVNPSFPDERSGMSNVLSLQILASILY
jgi:IPT/TIG domain-containing protein